LYPRTSLSAYLNADTQTDLAAGLGWVVFALLHIPLAYLMRQFPFISTGYALIVVMAGLILALSKRNSRQAVYVMAYIAGAEILWRMTEASVLWEFGKYATVAIIVLVVLTRRSFPKTASPMLYFALLVPSIAITVTTLSLGEARAQISFYLSGALALAACAWYFYSLPLTRDQIKNIFVLFITPVYGIFYLALSGTLNAPVEAFLSGESSLLTSGGYGPNQVSSILGLGALLALLYLLLLKPPVMLRIFLMITIVAFITQAALTLSRGGVYIFGASALVAIFYIYREPRQRLYLTLFLLFFLVLGYFLLPWLDQFTSGGLSARYADTSTTGRVELTQEELQIFLKNPIFGVGPGISAYLHAMLGTQFRTASHNEFTRLLAEHGLFGLAALLLLIYMTIRNFRQASTHTERAIAAALMVWALATMGYTALRFVAPALMFGLSGAKMAIDPVDEPPAEDDTDHDATSLNLPRPSLHHRITYRS
jgi:O-antigen ligase